MKNKVECAIICPLSHHYLPDSTDHHVNTSLPLIVVTAAFIHAKSMLTRQQQMMNKK
jgi:hypothetical protein